MDTALSRRRLIAAGAALPLLVVVRAGRLMAAPEIADRYEQSVLALSNAYPSAPVAETAQAARQEIRPVRRLLRDAKLTPDVKLRLQAVLGRLLAMLGNAQLDTGYLGPALHTLNDAHFFASLGKDNTGQAWVRLLQAEAEHTLGGLDAALDFARDGLRVAPARSPVAARLWAVGVAAPSGKQGQRSYSAVALDHAWTIVDSLDAAGQGIPGWNPGRYHPAELDADSAWVYVHAGNPEAALRHAEHGIGILDGSGAVAHRAFVRGDAARALLALGELEEAATFMSSALTVSEGRRLPEIGGRAREFVANARARGADVDDLAEQVHDWHVTAPV